MVPDSSISSWRFEVLGIRSNPARAFTETHYLQNQDLNASLKYHCIVTDLALDFTFIAGRGRSSFPACLILETALVDRSASGQPVDSDRKSRPVSKTCQGAPDLVSGCVNLKTKGLVRDNI